MATFYVLPPRECLEQAVTAFCERVLPGVPVGSAACEAFLAAVSGELSAEDDVFFLHREDLPAADDVEAELTAGFGAEPGDEVVEIGLAAGSVPARVRRWAVGAAVPEPGPRR